MAFFVCRAGPRLESTNPMQGLVIKKSMGSAQVYLDGQTLTCAISNRLRKELIYPIATPTSLKRKGKRVVAVKELDMVDPLAVGILSRSPSPGTVPV